MAATAGLRAGAVLMLLVCSACAGGSDTASEGERINLGLALEDTIAESLPDLVALSDAVVVGNVVDVKEGRVLKDLDGPPEGEDAADAVEGHDPIRFVDVYLRVDEVLFGEIRLIDPETSLIIYEEGFGIPPTSSLEGDSGVYFLVKRTKDAGAPPDYYRLTTSQGRLLFEDGGVLVSGNLREWETNLEGIAPSELMARVDEAIAAVSPSAAAS